MMRKSRVLMRRTRFVAVFAAIVVVSSFHVVPGADAASDTDRLATRAAQAQPTDSMGATQSALPLEVVGQQFQVADSTADSNTVVDRSAANGAVRITAPTSEALKVGLPAVLGAVDGNLSSDSRAVAYRSSNLPSSAIVAQVFEGDGVQLTEIMEGPNAPTAWSFPVDLPQGGRLIRVDAKMVAAVDASGAPIGFFGTPWARDANGAVVDTFFDISNNVVTQTVSHNAAGIAYPVTADPFLFKDLIKSARWGWIPRSPGGAIGAGWTLRVTPTTWARTFSAVTAGAAGSYQIGSLGFQELLKRYSPTLCCNLNTMRDQWIGHQQFVSAYEPNSTTWNLDEWRQDVSYASTVRYKCNPPRGGEYLYG